MTGQARWGWWQEDRSTDSSHRPGWPHYPAWSDLLPATPLSTPPPTYITDLTPSPLHWTLGRHPTHGTCCSQLSCFTDFHSPGFCKTFFGSRWETSDLLLRPQYCYRLIQTFRTPPPFLFNEDRQNSGTPTIKYSILCMTSTKKPPYYSPLYHRATFLLNSWVCTQLVWKWGVSLLSRGKTVWRTCVNRPNLERIFSSWRPQPSLAKHNQTSGLRYGASQNGHSFTKFFQLTGVFVGWGLDSGLSGTT